MKYKIFVSGVQKELQEDRFAVKEIITENILLQEYFKVFLKEEMPIMFLNNLPISWR
ncbi:MAG: hypothetical protein HZB30_04815 [Nitrospirae bacterium]|nr:hypothetical protein [Nitrospirota bacterium]